MSTALQPIIQTFVENLPAPSLMDRVVGYISPQRGLARLQAKARLSFLGGGGYVGARSDRKATKNWNPSSRSADGDTLGDLPSLRKRSRDLVRNTPLATGALNTWVTSTVGTGLRPQIQIDREFLGLSDEEADAWERQAERLWWAWAGTPACDVTGQTDFAGLQELFFRSSLEGGDAFAFRRFLDRQPGHLFRTQVQIVEGDRVSNPDRQLNTDRLVAGVQLDLNGRPIQYWVANRHPGEFGAYGPLTWRPMPVFGPRSGERIALHGYKRLRPGLTRGVPILAPVIETLKQLDRYTEAEVMAAVVSAMFTVFVTSKPNDDGTPGGLSSLDEDEQSGQTEGAGEIQLGNGLIVDLDEGEDVKIADPKRPNQSFDPFLMAVLRQVGVAIELPFEILIKHFTSSYSASRAAMLEAWRAFRMRRVWLAREFASPCYEWVLSEAIDDGLIQAPGFFTDPLVRRAWLGVRWVGPTPGQIDPLKEMAAAKLRIDEDIATRAEVTAEFTGEDWDQKVHQRAKEERTRRELGLVGVAAQSVDSDPTRTEDEEEE